MFKKELMRLNEASEDLNEKDKEGTNEKQEVRFYHVLTVECLEWSPSLLLMRTDCELNNVIVKELNEKRKERVR